MPTVIDPGGRAYDVPDEQVSGYLSSGFKLESSGERAQRNLAQANEDQFGGTAGTVAAAGLGALGTVTGGLSDVAISAVGGAEGLRQLHQLHPIASTAGAIAGGFVPTGLGGLASKIGAGVTEGLGAGLLARAVSGAAEGATYGLGQGVSDLATSRDPLTWERAAGTISSNLLYGGAAGGITTGALSLVDRGLQRAGTAIEDHIAARATQDAVPQDLTGLDHAGLRDARQQEIDRLVTEQATQKSSVVDDAQTYRAALKDANPWLVITEGESASQLNKANKDIRSAFIDPKGLRDNPGSIARPLRIQEQALESAIADRTTISSKLDDVNNKIYNDINSKLNDETFIPSNRDIRIHENKFDDYLEKTVPAKSIAERGYYEPPGGGVDSVRIANAKKAIEQGQRESIKLNVSEDGKITVTDGRHRLAAAIEANAPIQVKWSTGTPPAESDIFRGNPSNIELTGKAARRYATYSNVKLPKDGTLTLHRLEAQGFLDALKNGQVSSASRDALDKLQPLLDQNRALQAKLEQATISKADLASDRLRSIDAAKDALSAPNKPTSVFQKVFGGAAFGTATSAAHAIPIIGAIPGLAHMIGAKASEIASNVVFGRMGKAISETAGRTGAAIKAFSGSAEHVVKYAPVVASDTLHEIRYGNKGSEEKSTLPAMYHARSEEIRRQTAYDETGTSRVRPEARQAIADKLKPVAVINPVFADRLETIAVRKLEYLSSVLPRRPDLGGIPGPWQPSDMAIRSFARSMSAVENPIGIEERAVHGAITPEEAAAYWAVYPERAQHFQSQILTSASALPYQRRLALSIFARTQIDPATHPAVIAILQGQFASEAGTGGGIQAPTPKAEFGAIKKSVDQGTAAQHRSQGARI